MKPGWSSFMDRRVKERLVGATILVVLVVLIVPELLSGPKRPPAPVAHPTPAAEATRVVTVDLATSKATPVDETASPENAASGAMPDADAPSGAAAPRREAPPTISTLQAQQGDAGDNAASPRTAAVPGKPAAHESPTDNAHSRWALQLGSFANKSNAESLARRLHSQGFTAFVLPRGAGASLRYRVRVGPMADRGSAERVMARLKKDGHPASMVTP